MNLKETKKRKEIKCKSHMDCPVKYGEVFTFSQSKRYYADVLSCYFSVISTIRD